jgi:hypothetical protein
MDLDDLFDRPGRRRWWLLCKGLESGSPEEALQWARAADDFVDAPPLSPDISPSLEPPEPSVAASVWARESGEAEAPPIIEDELTAGEPELSLYDRSLMVLASTDDIVRYLRQQDDVVVGAGDGKQLVNGRCRPDPSELVTRANRMRERQGKPPFELISKTATHVMNRHAFEGN